MADAGKIKAQMELDASKVKKGAEEATQALNDVQKKIKDVDETAGQTNETLGGTPKKLKDIEQAGQQAGKNVSKSMEDIKKGLDNVMKTGQKLTATLTLPIVGFGASSVNVAREFEYSMSEVSAISGATGKNFERLTEQAKELGRTTFFSATEASQGMKYYAMA